MLDLPAFAYKLCIAALITPVARKYLQDGGAFPSGRKRMLGFFDAKDAFDGEFNDDVEDAKDIAREHTELLEAAPKFIVACKVPIQTSR